MEKSKDRRSFPADTVRVCVEQYGNYDVSGKIFGKKFAGGLDFDNAADLLLKTDLLLDERHRPQAFQQKRSFQKKRRALLQEQAGDSDESEETEIFRQSGCYGTYDVVIQSRKHASWQGFVRDEQGEFLGEFQSELNLMEIILRRTRLVFLSVRAE